MLQTANRFFWLFESTMIQVVTWNIKPELPVQYSWCPAKWVVGLTSHAYVLRRCGKESSKVLFSCTSHGTLTCDVELKEELSPTGSVLWTLCLQMVVLFGKVVSPLEVGDLLEGGLHWGGLWMLQSLLILLSVFSTDVCISRGKLSFSCCCHRACHMLPCHGRLLEL